MPSPSLISSSLSLSPSFALSLNCLVEDEQEHVLQEDATVFWVTACWIGVAAILGALLRIVMAQLFGEECANPGSVGWLSSGAPLCVTANGETLQEGGVLFADLPSNLLGSFIMGLLQDGAVLGLAMPLSIAFLHPQHPLQKCTIFHTALKTGFCGSLTTFSSWNSAMVVLIFGTGSSQWTQLWLALFGYVIGMETALGSFVCGKSLARYLHKRVNPLLFQEAQSVQLRHEEGLYICWELPDFERRYLCQLTTTTTTTTTRGGTESNNDYVLESDILAPSKLSCLEEWRQSTQAARRVRHEDLALLLDIETTLLVHQQPLSEEMMEQARAKGFAMDALLEWVAQKQQDLPHVHPESPLKSFSFADESMTAVNPTASSAKLATVTQTNSKWCQVPVAALCIWSILFGLFAATLVLSDHKDQVIVTYRTMAYAMLWAPLGALCRWRLSSLWNGQGLWQRHPWFPVGTFAANVLGSIVSIICVAVEYRLDTTYHAQYYNFWTIGSIRAIRIGFAGCLTTVSTFVAEIHGFMKHHTDYAYPYILSTLGTACVVSTILYAIITVIP